MNIKHFDIVNTIKPNLLVDWCSNSLKKKNIYINNLILSYKNWVAYINLFNKYCIPQKKQYIYINFEKYNYIFIEYMYIYLYKNNNETKFSILDFCSFLGIFIPHYCYHPDLSIAGNCRMCLVQVEKSAKLIASCAMPISHKMSINTQSILIKKAQEVF